MNREHRRPLTRPSAPLIPLHQFSITKKSLLRRRHRYRDSFFGRLWLYLYTRPATLVHVPFRTRDSLALARSRFSLVVTDEVFPISHQII